LQPLDGQRRLSKAFLGLPHGAARRHASIAAAFQQFPFRMLTVLGRAASINVRKVLWTCSELGLEPGREEWGAGELSLQSPRFLALNPNALVPVLLDGDLVLFESNTICRYLAARQGRHDLLPAEAAARARVEQWMDWQATELNNA
jgi:glutathione S-transferase